MVAVDEAVDRVGDPVDDDRLADVGGGEGRQVGSENRPCGADDAVGERNQARVGGRQRAGDVGPVEVVVELRVQRLVLVGARCLEREDRGLDLGLRLALGGVQADVVVALALGQAHDAGVVAGVAQLPVGLPLGVARVGEVVLLVLDGVRVHQPERLVDALRKLRVGARVGLLTRVVVEQAAVGDLDVRVPAAGVEHVEVEVAVDVLDGHVAARPDVEVGLRAAAGLDLQRTADLADAARVGGRADRGRRPAAGDQRHLAGR